MNHEIIVLEADTLTMIAVMRSLGRAGYRPHALSAKTDALGFMTAIKSPHTAGKYIEQALSFGYLVETNNPLDARSKLITMAPDTRKRIDQFFDDVVGKWQDPYR